MDIADSRTQLQELDVWRRRKLARAKRQTRQMVVAGERRHAAVRRRLAAQYLSGRGLEIGALFLPLDVPRTADVLYVDRFGVSELREHYPELDGFDLVTPNVIDNGETLATVPDGSVDFVIANHFIEHCEDPIGTLESHLRVLREGGALYMAVPDCRHTFDRERSLTPLAHLQRDHDEGPQWSRRAHYEEWARFVEGARGEDVHRQAEDLERRKYSIHYHVWTPTSFTELIAHCRVERGLPLEVEALERNDHEFIVIMSRST